MQPAVLIRLQPAGPWRFGPGDGGHDRVDTQFRSDRLYSAVSLAMRQLGWMDEWLEATARAAGSPALAFTSLFPYQGSTLFVTPPATLWPPPPSLLTTPSPVFLSKIRWKTAVFVPVSLVESILMGQPILADQWLPDAESSCLLRRDRLSTSPFRTVMRSSAAVDRITGATVKVHASACVEFEPGAGLWTVVRYRDEAARSDWGQRIAAAFRLLAESGFGGKRSSGWGQTEAPQFEEGNWPGVLLPKLTRALSRNGASDAAASTEPPLHWLLSLFAPGETDKVDWQSGDYRVVVRGGFVDKATESKKQVRLVTEGSVLAAPEELIGTAVDVAPEDFEHPVYRSGMAVSFKLPAFVAPPVPEPAATELEQILSELHDAVAAEEPAAEEKPPAEEPAPLAEPEPEPETEPAGAEDEAVSTETSPEEPAVETPVQEPESAPVEEVSASEQVSRELVEAPERNPPGSPELSVETPYPELSPEVEEQESREQLGSIEDPEGHGEGPDHGV